MHTLAWIAVLLACSGPGATTTATSMTTVTSTETGESATTTASTDATLSTTSTSTTADDTTTACSFLCGPDGGDDHLQCDPFAQDCPEGEKCSAWVAGGCCIPFCDLNAPACPPETECVPWFDDPPPTFESLGSCTLPA